MLALRVMRRMMNTMVLMLVDGGAEDADQALRGYCMLHRLFVAMVQHYPELRKEIRDRLHAFMRDPSVRTKLRYPNLGELVPLLSVCEEVGWLDIAVPLIQESFARSVLWVCRDVPELATLASCPVDGDLAAPATFPPDMLQRIFDASVVGRQIYSFHCCFLKLVAGPRGVNRSHGGMTASWGCLLDSCAAASWQC